MCKLIRFSASLPIIGAALLILAASCGEASPEPTETQRESAGGSDYENLVTLLRDNKLDVTELGRVKTLCFIVEPAALIVDGGTIEVYEYSDTESAAVALAKISPNLVEPEGLPEAMVEDFSYVHYYKAQRLLVRYLGTSPVLEELLESALGTEFANGNSSNRC